MSSASDETETLYTYVDGGSSSFLSENEGGSRAALVVPADSTGSRSPPRGSAYPSRDPPLSPRFPVCSCILLNSRR